MVKQCGRSDCSRFVKYVGVVNGVSSYECEEHGLIPSDEVEKV